MNIWLFPIIAFLLGSIPFGLLIAKSQGINIREHGSGNIGATNVLRIVGKKFGITCFFLDFLKGLIPTLLAYNLYKFTGADETMTIGFLREHAINLGDNQFKAQALQVFTGLCAILGHNYSPWVNFKGGKGIATSAGVLLPLMPFAFLLLIAIFFITFKISRYVSLASIVAAASLPLLVLYGSWSHGKLAAGTWNKPLLIFAVFIAIMAIWKHRSNIKKLLAGEENKFTPKNKKKA
ncbi:MAG: glycerol-3-phosphate 1-O-acyltransferase PlsY [Akkermansiaceae bacterium]